MTNLAEIIEYHRGNDQDHYADALERLATADAWVSVAERLPKRNDYVLIAPVDYGVWVGWLDDSGLWHAFGARVKGDDVVSVTHWRPLPAPPAPAANPK